MPWKPSASSEPRFRYRSAPGGEWSLSPWLPLPFCGRHQAHNAAVALAIVEQLRSQGLSITADAIRTGLASARCPARIEVLHSEPTVVVDVAHNMASVAALVEVIREHFPPGPRILVFAGTRDKDVAGMLRLLLPHFDEVIFTRYLNNPRAIPPERLVELASQLSNTPHTQTADPAGAWQLAQQRIGPEHLVCITGSFFLAAEMRGQVLAHQWTQAVAARVG